MPTNLVRDNDKGNRDKRLVAIVTPLYRFPSYAGGRDFDPALAAASGAV